MEHGDFNGAIVHFRISCASPTVTGWEYQRSQSSSIFAKPQLHSSAQCMFLLAPSRQLPARWIITRTSPTLVRHLPARGMIKWTAILTSVEAQWRIRHDPITPASTLDFAEEPIFPSVGSIIKMKLALLEHEVMSLSWFDSLLTAVLEPGVAATIAVVAGHFGKSLAEASSEDVS